MLYRFGAQVWGRILKRSAKEGSEQQCHRKYSASDWTEAICGFRGALDQQAEMEMRCWPSQNQEISLAMALVGFTTVVLLLKYRAVRQRA